MRSFGITLVFFTSLCYASQLPRPGICGRRWSGGDTINGSIVRQKKPLKFAQLRLYSSTGKTAWVGMTDKDGSFRITHLPPDTLSSRRSRMGTHNNPLEPGFEQIAQRTNTCLLSATHGERVCWHYNRRELTVNVDSQCSNSVTVPEAMHYFLPMPSTVATSTVANRPLHSKPLPGHFERNGGCFANDDDRGLSNLL